MILLKRALALCCVCWLITATAPSKAADATTPSTNISDCAFDPKPPGLPVPSSSSGFRGSQQLFSEVMPAILNEHARLDLEMYWKYLSGFAYSHEPPPRHNPLLETEEDIEKYLRSVSESEQPAGLLVYWRVQARGEQELCVGLALSGKRMLVERSPLTHSDDIHKLMRFRNSLNLRVAQPRLARVSSDPSPDRGEVTTDFPPDLVAVSEALLPGTIRKAIQAGIVRSLLIVPIDNLAQVPFAALPITDPQSPLIDFTTLSVAPSLNIVRSFSESRRRAREITPMALIIGDPDLSLDPKWIFPPLPGAHQEASDVAAIFHTAPLLGKSASHSAVLAALSKPETPTVIYFATHAVADPKNPQDGSFLALRGRNLYTREVEKLKLNGGPLVVLSACQTGLGKVFEEGATFGMAQAWYYSGAGVVVTSLWNVDDLATHALMTDFMQEAQKASPARAMAEAMRMGRRRDPNYLNWASFAVYGGLPMRLQDQEIRTSGK